MHLAHCFINVDVHLCWRTIHSYSTFLAPVVTLASTNDFIWVFSACVLLTYFLFNCFVLWQGVEEVYLLVVSFSHVLQYDQLVLFSNQAAQICEKQYWISLSIFNPLFMRLVENFQFSMTYVQNIFLLLLKVHHFQ